MTKVVEIEVNKLSISIPTPNDVVSFVVFFFPGFLTFWLSSELCGVKIKQRSDLEKIVLSSIFSIFSFSIIGVSLRAEDISTAIFNRDKIFLIFVVSIALSIVLWIIVKIWNLMNDIISVRLQTIWSRLGRTYRSNEKLSSYLLKQFYSAKEKNELIIVTSSKETYRGCLGGYYLHPLEITLIKTKTNSLKKLKDNNWEEIDEYLLYFNEKDIKRIGAIGLKGESN